MHALFVEVNVDESMNEQARERLQREEVPRAREAGANAGYWLAAQAGRGVAVVLFDSEDAAKRAAETLTVGEAPSAEAPPGVTFRTVEVREVLAGL